MDEKKIKVVFEDETLMVVDKPPFLVTTKERKGETGTLEDWLSENRKIKLPRCGIVHRLDKGTSGLVIVAKTESALVNLKEQFKKRSVKKHYWAMVGGDLPLGGQIDMPIGRSKYGFSKFAVTTDGKRAETWFKVISKYRYKNKIYSFLEIELKTGRTHQIRVHMNYLKWPLIGDKLYGGEEVEGLERPFLHAFEISFLHPVTNQIVKLFSELPADLENIKSGYEKP